MKINLGIAPIAWSNDDMPDLGGDTPIETCLFEARSAGFRGIELGGKFPRNPGTIKYLLNKFNLEMPGGWYGAHLNERSVEEEWQAMQNQIELHKLINSSVFIFADVSGSIQGEPIIPLSKRPILKDNEWDDYCNKISEISKRLSDIGLPMSYHEHMGTIIQSEQDVYRLLDNTDDKTSLLFDTGHILFAEGDYESILKKYVSRVNHVHCKDIRKEILNRSLSNDSSFRDSFLEGVFTVPGDGCINYKPLFETLHDNKYSKWLIVEAEQDPKKANPLKYAKIGYKYLNRMLTEVGYQV
ncbi:MAG: myo-inosose-2 dehydratase [Pelagibacteraceae bacterium]|jgi:inosose dehydratase|nr:myo-inosose-2 dehydratase [Pelagibacteraceae bacterium]MDP6784807.1 myo-inosose-2 dehydratase [Alphaproteobacteria bacterium]MBO6467769.1 myo-inosose-2 dehydratase [Pelagibacteraceae bacterium]MBO6469193.1 myo-inosose-2 dehydratase [Pelagibacteraceae bacterium]MBO6479284.1 myo-inosose-2 dehydratase [Pelagibacteraceae bacterium]|tara:strand:+ start:886 stop:1779 length:894 start_codon:yes stop_codon:yes gene_type:complete